MYGPSEEQRKRIHKLVTFIQQQTTALWNMDEHIPNPAYFSVHFSLQDFEARLDALMDELKRNFATADIDTMVTDYYVHPAEHMPVPKDNLALIYDIVGNYLAEFWLSQHPSEYAFAGLTSRIQFMLSSGPEGKEQEKLEFDQRIESEYLIPRFGQCVKILANYRQVEGMLDFVEALLRGQWDKEINANPKYSWEPRTYCEAVHWDYQARESFIQWMHESGRYTYDFYRQSVDHFNISSAALLLSSAEDVAQFDELDSVQYRYAERYAEELIAALPHSQLALSHCFSDGYRGSKWLVHGIRYLSEHDYNGKMLIKADDHLRSALTKLINIRGDDLDSEPGLVDTLKTFKQKALLAALPISGAGRRTILQALDWNNIMEFDHLVMSYLGYLDTSSGYEGFCNCIDPKCGVIDLQGLQRAMKAGGAHVSAYLKAFSDAKVKLGDMEMFIQAIHGNNRSVLEKKLVRHGQSAIKAYGLLPVEDNSELSARYLAFKRIHKEATQYGQQRQANTQAAVKAGLDNLAQVAGFEDATRMEWTLEAQLSANPTLFTERHGAGDWELQLVLEGISPKIITYKGGKQLNTVPAGVKKTEIYIQLKEKQAQIKDQASRFKRTLEDMMCQAQPIVTDDWKLLLKLPVVRNMLERLIIKTQDGHLGLLSPQDEALVDLRGSRVALTGTISIAHVYDLYCRKELSSWQRHIVQQEMIQPFKQAFRELYILTPAEEQTATYSNRFAGHQVRSDITGRLLQSRGWRLTSGDSTEVHKYFPNNGITAEIIFPDSGHFLSENPDLTTDQIIFKKNRDTMHLRDVPVLVFSEAMRDADLVVSVANIDETKDIWSNETYERRAEIFRNLMEKLKLKNVELDGRYAFVQGKIARYRIHLGSAAIHIEPGNYLCVVPESDKKEQIYLPFADTDRKVSEVLSKIFLLLNDHKIKDTSIMAQINAAVNS